MKNSPTIIVTGGCGFIGSHFVKLLLRSSNVSIVNLDMLTYAGNTANLETLSEEEQSRYTHITADICDEPLMRKLIGDVKPAAIVHFAAESHVDRSYFSASDFIRTNIEGTRVLIEAIRHSKLDTKFIHISTDEIYGDMEPGQYATEESPLRPSNVYAASKAGADLLVQSFVRTHQVPAVIVRGSNNYGTHQYPEKLIPMAITNMLIGNPIPLHGDGSHQRSWLHVEDFCCSIAIALAQAPIGTIWNASGEIYSNLDILRLIASALGSHLGPQVKQVGDRPGADFRYAPSSDKLQSHLHWSRQHTLEKAIIDIISWYKCNEKWWQDIRSKESFSAHFQLQAKGQWY